MKTGIGTHYYNMAKTPVLIVGLSLLKKMIITAILQAFNIF
jgi:hypothetical protein